MQFQLNGQVLLLGEANFSFSLSLINYYESRNVTATCYESKSEAERKYGAQLVNHNVNKLNELKCKQVLYEIDACQLDKHFVDERFDHIIFMFPHVGGKSNLRKNRQLIDNFLHSARNVLNTTNLDGPSIFITLAKGQGGTKFEEDPKKQNVKDCWQVLQLAQKNGFIMTECFKLDEEKFKFYKSTGFRSQSKSFETKSGLVHRFSLSLPLPRLDQAMSFQQMHSHPLIEIKDWLLFKLADSINVKTNLINNNNSLKENCLNVSCGLTNRNRNFTSTIETVDEFNNLKYEIRINYLSDKSKMDKLSFTFLNVLDELIKSKTKLFLETQKSETRFFVHFKRQLAIIEQSEQEIWLGVDLSLLLSILFELENERLLYSDDERVLCKNIHHNTGLDLSYSIKAYSIENPKWLHDISFWYEPELFRFEDFIRLIDQICLGLVIRLELLEVYKKESNECLACKHAVCFRLTYQSCDRALSWEQTTKLQYALRDHLELMPSISLR